MSGTVKHFNKHLAGNIRKAQSIGLKSRGYHNIATHTTKHAHIERGFRQKKKKKNPITNPPGK